MYLDSFVTLHSIADVGGDTSLLNDFGLLVKQTDTKKGILYALSGSKCSPFLSGAGRETWSERNLAV